MDVNENARDDRISGACEVELAQMAQEDKPQPSIRFTTIKVRESVRRWIKMEAAERNVPMYVLVEQLLTKAACGRPWEKQVQA